MVHQQLDHFFVLIPEFCPIQWSMLLRFTPIIYVCSPLNQNPCNFQLPFTSGPTQWGFTGCTGDGTADFSIDHGAMIKEYSHDLNTLSHILMLNWLDRKM